MARAQDGDAEAYRALLDDVSPLVLGVVRRRVASADEVDDVGQEVLLALHRARHTYDPARPFEPWLYAIARHVVADHVRRRVRRRAEVLTDAPPEVGAAGDGLAKPALEQAWRRLPAAQREALELVGVEGLSVEAAAARAGTTPGALKVRFHRAYRALQRLLGG
jgi:RNA polymerase sigma-70 factor (ECF subfamily)